MAIRIEYLSDHIDSIPDLAKWHHEEWKELLTAWTFEQAVDELRTHTGRRQVPTTLVAFEGSRMIGSASLLASDLDGWQHLSPWLASVYVQRDQRGKGIGRRLVKRVAEEARELGFMALHLWTEGQRALYEHLGWQVIGTARLGLADISVMRISLGQ